jgi:prepilin-type N-terminal cleavage/methylation domain-containing protein
MILRRSRSSSALKRFGFTLVELAIVMGVAGVLFAGLYRLISGGNQQLRDQSSANLQLQLITAVKSFLASPDGQTYMTTNTACGGNCAVGANFLLPLPSSGNAAGSAGCSGDGQLTAIMNVASQRTTWCSLLPPGFSSATSNSYGQVFYPVGGLGGIRVLPNIVTPGVTPTTYSFMIITAGGTSAPDTVGGRLSSLIGGDGGFIYSSNLCNASFLQYACGAYGAWSANINSFGFSTEATGGYVASRTYVAPEQDAGSNWLERNTSIQPDPTFAYNTMTTNLFIGLNTGGTNANLYMGPSGNSGIKGGNIIMASSSATSNGGTLDMVGGTIDLQNGVLQSTGTTGNSVSLVPTTKISNPMINVGSGCTKSSYNDATCPAAVQVTGDLTVTNFVVANSLYATTYYYYSDRRLKTNIKTLRDPLDDVMKLDPVSYTFKSGGKEGMGVIAQDLEKIYPQLVSGKGDAMKAVDYVGLIAPLIGSVQQLKLQNDELRQELKDQAAQQANLQKQIDALKK